MVAFVSFSPCVVLIGQKVTRVGYKQRLENKIFFHFKCSEIEIINGIKPYLIDIFILELIIMQKVSHLLN